MVDWQGWLAISAFLGVMALVTTEATNLMIAALLGALLLIFSNVLNLPEAVDYISRGHQTLALFLGVMILVRSFEPTKVFDYIAVRVLILAQGSGKLILLSIVALTSVICSVLPNATTVLLLGPLLPPIATQLGLEFVPLLILMILTANSAGLLTLVGDPATFIVGDAINISFGDYFFRLSLAGVLAIATIVLMLPWLFPRTWRAQLSVDANLELPTVQHPRAVVLGGLITAVMLVFFVIGESLPVPVSPAAIAPLGATLGGNGTIVGASANIVGAGIAELHGQTISARKFLAFGMPVMLVQLFVTALFLTFRFLLPL